MIIHEHGKITRKFINTDAGNEDGREEPAMVLYRQGVKGKCAIIPLSCAYKYDDPSCTMERLIVLESALGIAKALDFPLNGRSAARIVAAVQDGLDELVRMPSRGKRQQQGLVGEATLIVNGERQITTPVRM